jgi:hypothetical protein
LIYQTEEDGGVKNKSELDKAMAEKGSETECISVVDHQMRRDLFMKTF